MWRLAHHAPNVRHHRESVSGRSLAGGDRLGCGHHQFSQGSAVESSHRPGDCHCASSRRPPLPPCSSSFCFAIARGLAVRGFAGSRFDPHVAFGTTSPARGIRERHRHRRTHGRPLVRAVDGRSPRLAGDRHRGYADHRHLSGILTRCARQVDGDCRAPGADPDGPAGGDRRDAAPPAHVSRLAHAACRPREHRGARPGCLHSAASGARQTDPGVRSAGDRGDGDAGDARSPECSS